MTRGPVEASAIRAERVQWRWRNRVAVGGIHEIAGRPDKGKGVLVAHIAAHISRQGPVIISTAEEIPSLMTKPRLEVAGARIENVKFWRLWLPASLPELSAYVRENNVKLLVLDPLARHLSNGVNRFTDSITRVLDPLQILCEETGLSVLIVDHVIKRVSANDEPLNAIGGGSSGVGSAARAVYIFGIDPSDPDGRYLATVKCNMRLWERGESAVEALRFEFDSEDHPDAGSTPILVPHSDAQIDPMTLLRRTTQTGRPSEKRAEAEAFLSTYLAGARGPVRASTVIDDGRAHHITAKTLHNARKQIDIVVDPPGGGRYTTWALREYADKPEVTFRKEGR